MRWMGVGCLLLVALPAAAQRLPEQVLPAGTVVRLHAPAGAPTVGKLVAPFGPDAARARMCLYPAPPCSAGDARYVEYPASDVLGLDVYRGSQWLGWAAVSGSMGALIGGMLAVSLAQDSDAAFSTMDGISLTLLPGLVFGAVGGLIGQSIKRWESVY